MYTFYTLAISTARLLTLSPAFSRAFTFTDFHVLNFSGFDPDLKITMLAPAS